MQFARPHDCRAKIGKDFCAYIFASRIRTSSQCKKSRHFFIKLDEKILNLREISEIRYCISIHTFVLLHCERCELMQCTPK